MLPKIYPITCHTDHVGTGSTFVAIKGFEQDGNKYIEKAIKLGAKKIILEDYAEFSKKTLPKEIEFIFTGNARKALAIHSAEILGNPASKLKIIGITGTKGKTSTTFIIEHILKTAGHKTALLGTIKNKILNQEIESKRTTPQSDYFQMFLHECVKQNVEYVVMEVSAHALSLDRVYGIEFDAVGFTNLAPEHMDFYKNLEKYFEAKSLIFNQIKKDGSVIINTEDEWGKKAFKNQEYKNYKLTLNPFVLSLSKDTNGILNRWTNFNKNTFKINQNNLNGLNFSIQKKYEINSPQLFGEFNIYNLTMAFLICKQLGLKTEEIISAIKDFDGIPGRLQMHTLKNKAKTFVDYAHNPSSMEAVLKTLKPLSKKLIVVFGCGGDRDKTKRPVMGKLATKYADKVIITDDNPRFEEPQNIINEILTGIDSKDLNKVTCELDRKKAIELAVKSSCKNSVIALLGKGHENYYSAKGKTFYFDDFEQISKF